jgi:hypothetical protein
MKTLEEKLQFALAQQQARFDAEKAGRLEQDREVRRLIKQGYSETIALCLYAAKKQKSEVLAS